MWFFGGQETQRFRVHYKDPAAQEKLTSQLTKFLRDKFLPTGKRLAIVCVGTDRSTGDSLGPLTGTLLSRDFPGIPVLGRSMTLSTQQTFPKKWRKSTRN